MSENDFSAARFRQILSLGDVDIIQSFFSEATKIVYGASPPQAFEAGLVSELINTGIMHENQKIGFEAVGLAGHILTAQPELADPDIKTRLETIAADVGSGHRLPVAKRAMSALATLRLARDDLFEAGELPVGGGRHRARLLSGLTRE